MRTDQAGFSRDVEDARVRELDGVELPASLGQVGVVAGGDRRCRPRRLAPPGVQHHLALVLQVRVRTCAGLAHCCLVDVLTVSFACRRSFDRRSKPFVGNKIEVLFQHPDFFISPRDSPRLTRAPVYPPVPYLLSSRR